MYRFEWDPRKAAANWSKHGVSFDEASTVFDDVFAVIFDDEGHSEEEARELIIGHSVTNRLLIVSFVERSGNRVRLISVRVATKRERQEHEDNARSRH